MNSITPNPGQASGLALDGRESTERYSDDFDIRNHIDLLEPNPKRETDKYVCPVCECHNLSINKKTGEYNCYGGKTSPGCSGGDVKIAVKKLAGTFIEKGQSRDRNGQPRSSKRSAGRSARSAARSAGRSPRSVKRSAARSAAAAPAAPPITEIRLDLAQFPQPNDTVTRRPDWVFTPNTIDFQPESYTVYDYSSTQRVVRFSLGKQKAIRPYHLHNDRWELGAGLEAWPLYGFAAAGSWALALEGEKNVNIATARGIPAVCPRGKASIKTLPALYAGLRDVGVTGILAIADNDEAGRGSAETAIRAAHAVGLPAIAISITDIWPDAPEKADLFDWVIQANAMPEPQDIIDATVGAASVAAVRAANTATAAEVAAEAAEAAAEDEDGFEEPVPGQGLIQEIDRLLDRQLYGSEFDAAIAELAALNRQSQREVKAIVQQRLKERDRSEERDHTIRELERQRLARKARLDMRRVLPEPLAAAIEHLANWLSLRPETYLFTLLATTSTLHSNGTELRLLNSTNYDITPGLYAGIVAPPSQRKTPIVKAIATKPLQRLHEAQTMMWESKMEDWKQECYRLQETSKETPPEPERRLYHFTNTTGEAIVRQAARQPDSGLLYLCDELKSLFGNANSYRSGKGSDIEDLLRYYDGDGGKVLRSEGLRDDVNTFNFGIVGAIQPEVLRSLMGDGSDTNGQWSRFMFVNQPVVENIITSDGGSVDITGILQHAYQRIDALPPIHYRLAPDAHARWLERRNQYERMRCAENRPAMAAYFGKSDGRIGKIAMTLHALEWAMDDRSGNAPSLEIPLHTIEAAIAIVDFSIAQIESIYAENQSSAANTAPHLAKILEHLERKGELKPRDVYTGIVRRAPDGKAPNSTQVIEWFKELEQMGLATTKKSGKSLILLSASPDKVGGVGAKPVINVIKSPKPIHSERFHDDKPRHQSVIKPISVIKSSEIPEKFDDTISNDDSFDDSSIIPETQSTQEFQRFDGNDDNDDSPKLENQPQTLDSEDLISDDTKSLGQRVKIAGGDDREALVVSFDRLTLNCYCWTPDSGEQPRWVPHRDILSAELPTLQSLGQIAHGFRNSPEIADKIAAIYGEQALKDAIATLPEKRRIEASNVRKLYKSSTK